MTAFSFTWRPAFRACIRAATPLAWAAMVACSTSADERATSVPRRPCGLTVWYRSASAAARVFVVGSWDGGARPGLPLPAERADGWRVGHLPLPPGEYTYVVVDDGAELANPSVSTTAVENGREVTWARVDRCDEPALRVNSALLGGDWSGRLTVTFLAAEDGAPLDPSSVTITERSTERVVAPQAVTVPEEAPRSGGFTVDLPGLAAGKHTFEINAGDTKGRRAEGRRASIWVERATGVRGPTDPFDLRDTVVYQVMLDRFRDDEGRALAAPEPASGRAGGTLRGFRRYLESGALEALGVTTLWLSPLYKNPDGLFPGDAGHTYSSYHGYWPVDSRATDPRVATEAEVDTFLTEAHRRGLRVVFDVVPNHVHEQHPYWARYRDAGWFNRADPACVCGQGACDWAGHIQTCWFAPYMPDLDWTNPDVARQISDDVAWWLQRFDADGVRIDAVPMMPRSATRRLTATLRERYEHPGNPLLLLGENFTGPGGYDLLRYQLGPHGLDGQFHFPLMWSLRAAVAHGREPMSAVAEAMEAGERAWHGSGAVMGTMIGNHDVTRFASEAAGDADASGWTPAPQPLVPLVYAKQRLALGLIFTLPGAPVVYYGDEIGLAGRADPDSRRVMPAEDALNDEQRATATFASQVGQLRKCSRALRRGTYRTLFAGPEAYAFAREIGERDDAERVVVVVTRKGDASISGPLPGIPAGSYVDGLTGERESLSPELTKISARPFSLRVLFPATSPCAFAVPHPSPGLSPSSP